MKNYYNVQIQFVRIEPGSILQLLYPCSRYSPDQCLICGGSYRDHLALWWAKHLYTPYDRIMDRTYKGGVVFEDSDEGAVVSNKSRTKNRPRSYRGNHRRGSKTRSSHWRHDKTKPTMPTGPPKIMEFAFHRQYVLDKSHLLKDITSKKEEKRVLANELLKRGLPNDGKVEEVEVPERGVSYLVPAEPTGGGRFSLTLGLARWIALRVMDNLIEIEAIEAEETTNP